MGRIIAAYMRGEAPAAELFTVANLGFVVTCAASSLFFVAAFVRFARPSRLFESLSKNAYGIYLLHFAAVSWLAYALLRADLPGALKGVLVAVGAAAVSWVVTAGFRRVPGVRRVLS